MNLLKQLLLEEAFNWSRRRLLFCGFCLLLIGAASGQKIVEFHPDYAVQPMQSWEKQFSGFQFREFTMDGHSLPFRIYKPANIVRGKKYPLVLFMHGYGERGIDNRKQFFRFKAVPFWQKYPCFIIAPQCPETDPGGESTWVKTNFGASSSTMKAQPTWPMALAMALLDQVIAQNPVDKQRIYVTGLSMGGFATWELLQRMPGRFAAAMPLSGGADIDYAPKLSHIPIWVFHGMLDSTVLPKRSIDMVNALKKAGGKTKLTLYPNLGHDTWTTTYSNWAVWDWLFTKKKML